ncbi:HAD family hydrolase [Amycolatopsis rifamycinica]|uniref:HAD family hydrolase n=1 Tax=Amycolatopsis rifamycinica TaxID=287986 RepID=A0A066U001_9PSEU|nr:HAD-IB family hydrolase [Amycolatopsis rifamycinica]KDN20435.1 hypothetical protein DV20_21020 [Amycolatopsis rifamycinica]
MNHRLAFFDVDGTLLTVTSLFRFLAYDCAVRGEPESYVDFMAELDRLKAAGASRVEANRAFFGAFAGRSVADLVTGGRRWFELERSFGGLFDPRVLTMLRAHSAGGDLVVLLSGSFAPCLGPIARLTGADVVVCTEPEIHDGRYTGRVADPMVGPRKAEAAAAIAAGHGIDPADCFSYGDDASDLAVLELTGCPVVVGDDPVLAERARRLGWRRIPSLPIADRPLFGGPGGEAPGTRAKHRMSQPLFGVPALSRR